MNMKTKKNLIPFGRKELQIQKTKRSQSERINGRPFTRSGIEPSYDRVEESFGTKKTTQEFKFPMAELAQRLEFVGTETVSFSEVDGLGKKTYRIGLPKPLLKSFEGLKGSFRLALAFQNYLVFVPCEYWPAYLRSKHVSLPCAASRADIQRNSHTVEEIDRKARFKIPRELAEKAQFKEEVVFCVVDGIVEIWDKDVHSESHDTLCLAAKAKLGIPT
jgi:DNA-binding transcriptional regulator/RsmH inhibitor MraZ